MYKCATVTAICMTAIGHNIYAIYLRLYLFHI